MLGKYSELLQKSSRCITSCFLILINFPLLDCKQYIAFCSINVVRSSWQVWQSAMSNLPFMKRRQLIKLIFGSWKTSQLSRGLGVFLRFHSALFGQLSCNPPSPLSFQANEWALPSLISWMFGLTDLFEENSRETFLTNARALCRGRVYNITFINYIVYTQRANTRWSHFKRFH